MNIHMLFYMKHMQNTQCKRQFQCLTVIFYIALQQVFLFDIPLVSPWDIRSCVLCCHEGFFHITDVVKLNTKLLSCACHLNNQQVVTYSHDSSFTVNKPDSQFNAHRKVFSGFWIHVTYSAVICFFFFCFFLAEGIIKSK